MATINVQRSMSIPSPSSSLRRSNSIFLTPSKWSFLPWVRPTDDTLEVTPEERSRKQDEAWEQAMLNAFAFLGLFVAGCIALAVYYVLEPFLHSLLWAALIGTLLHPLKYRSTATIRRWLQYLERSSIPLSLGLVLSPVFVFGWLSTTFECYARSHWRQLMLAGAGVVCLTVAYVINAPVHLYRGTAWVVGVLKMGSSITGPSLYVQVGFLMENRSAQ